MRKKMTTGAGGQRNTASAAAARKRKRTAAGKHKTGSKKSEFDKYGYPGRRAERITKKSGGSAGDQHDLTKAINEGSKQRGFKKARVGKVKR